MGQRLKCGVALSRVSRRLCVLGVARLATKKKRKKKSEKKKPRVHRTEARALVCVWTEEDTTLEDDQHTKRFQFCTKLTTNESSLRDSQSSRSVSRDRRPRRNTTTTTIMGGDDELAKHTKVKITGNNRTKQKLIGLNATVKKSVGLGGWHWLVLENGKEVRLQKNALEVVSLPTGEEVESIEFQTKEDDEGSHVESGEIEEMDGDEEMKEENEKEEKNGDPMEEDGNKQGREGDQEEKKEGEEGEDGEGEEEDEEGEEGEKEGGMKARLRRPT